MEAVYTDTVKGKVAPLARSMLGVQAGPASQNRGGRGCWRLNIYASYMPRYFKGMHPQRNLKWRWGGGGPGHER